ncbi:LysE family transporter [Ignatzschineria rhizosphaerae]|uniref:LysE family transporter n=1 Tax=Ignatzschineria rhizosphaerae TaxID=2923279 RepID=A0ABY3XA25_9GAMM|nr:LysE family transporter [Ignatzschineria rhizosphaerae]
MLLITVAGIHLMALITPGPDFFLVTQVAVSHSRREATMAVIGITLGVAVWAVVALLGLHVLVEKLPWIQTILYFAGGSYLSYLGYLLLRSSYIQIKRQKNVHTGRVGDESESAPKIQIEKQYKNRLLLKGLLTNLANPKALIYFGSVFVLFVGGQVSNVVRVEIFALVVIETFLWFMLVAILFSLPKLKALYQSVGGYIDGIAGIFFVGFGLNLIYQSIMALIS